MSRRGLRVHGIDMSPAMLARVNAAQGGSGVHTTVGDFATDVVGDGFSLVYLVRNTITNLTTQEGQVAAFQNAAAHLAPGGRFVVENYVPGLRRLPPGEVFQVFASTREHFAYEEYDTATQIAVSHHRWSLDGEHREFSSRHRYAWPSELDLMARLAGLTLRERWDDWRRGPFTGESRGHVSVWEKG